MLNTETFQSTWANYKEDNSKHLLHTRRFAGIISFILSHALIRQMLLLFLTYKEETEV